MKNYKIKIKAKTLISKLYKKIFLSCNLYNHLNKINIYAKNINKFYQVFKYKKIFD